MKKAGFINYRNYSDALKKAVAELDKAQEMLIIHTGRVLDDFWEEAKAQQKFIPFAFNVTVNGSSFRIRWGRLYVPKNGKNNKTVRMNHISKPAGDRYPVRILGSNCPQWFVPLFVKYEDRLAEIRQIIRQNREIRRRVQLAATQYEKLAAQQESAGQAG